MEKKLRLLVHPKGAPAWNMAVDEALFISAKEKRGLPCLRVYTWKNPCVTAGCFVPYEDAQTFAAGNASSRRRLTLVRRPTGGGIVLHDRDLTFSLSGHTASFFGAREINKTYAMIHQAVYEGFKICALFAQELFIMKDETRKRAESGRVKKKPSGVCFHEPVNNDVMLGSEKLAGGAQKRSGDAFLHQGTVKLPEMLSFTEGLKMLCGGMQSVFQMPFQISTLTADERSKARVLEQEKYRSKKWNETGDYKGMKKGDFVGRNSGKRNSEREGNNVGR